MLGIPHKWSWASNTKETKGVSVYSYSYAPANCVLWKQDEYMLQHCWDTTKQLYHIFLCMYTTTPFTNVSSCRFSSFWTVHKATTALRNGNCKRKFSWCPRRGCGKEASDSIHSQAASLPGGRVLEEPIPQLGAEEKYCQSSWSHSATHTGTQLYGTLKK